MYVTFFCLLSCLVLHSIVLLGVVSLGFFQLMSAGLELSLCTHKNDIFLPILQFSFSFLMMHFLLGQARHGIKLAFSNLSIAHLLATQITLWLVNFDSNYGFCGYSSSNSLLTPNSTHHEVKVLRDTFSPIPLHGLLAPVVHHYQLLMIFVLMSLWLMNNNTALLDACSAFTLTRRRSIFLDDESAYNFLKEKTSSIKGFFFGFLTFSSSIVVLFHQDHQLSLITHTSLQVRRR